MSKIIEGIILFIFSFVLIFILYQLFIVRRAKSKRKAKEPFEVSYLVNRYKLDLKKINYNKLLRIVSLVSSFDIALVVLIIIVINNFYLEIIVGFISMILIILISYHLVYLGYKRKGMIKNESKRNRG
ncbi:MAG: hypothetical protein IJ097_00985 [Bacilli bacterium]|nr:hypothetical protein [Bacilli bacterium]